MNKSEVFHRIREVGLVPVLRAAKQDHAIAIAHAIEQGGVPILEVTLTVPGAIEAIRHLCGHFGKRVLVGAGTVLSAEMAEQCIAAGAEFIVSPSLKVSTIEACHRLGVLIIPGALTPTEIVTAWEAGADAVKVFPCGSMGGASYIKSLKAPFPQIEFVPTGGVSLATAADYLKAGACALGVGADLIDPAAVASGNFHKITANARQYLEIVKETRTAK